METNKNLTFFIISVISIFLCSCKSIEDGKEVQDPPKNLVYVLCDLSASIDRKQTKDNILKAASGIFHSMPANTEYYFMPITSSPEPAIFKGNTGKGRDRATVYGNNLATYKEQMVKLDKEFGKNTSNRTCVIDAIEAVSESLNAIRGYEDKYDKINLIVISDMMECCPVNGQFVNFEKIPFDERSADQVIAKWPNGRNFLSNTKKLNITVVFNSKANKGYVGIKTFWKKLFKAAGYSKVVPFVTDFNAGTLD